MKKKILALSLCAVLLVVAVIGGTLAYFTDVSETAENTFTVGDVQITLDEAKVDEYGVEEEDEDRVIANEYLMIPGHTYTKDPTTTVLADSEDCYVRMKVTVVGLDALKAAIPAEKYENFYKGDLFLLQTAVDGWDNGIWNSFTFDDETDTYEFRYYQVVEKSDSDTVLEPLFTSFTLPGFLDNEAIASLADLEFDIVAEAIQADTFDDAAAAWAAFDAQVNA